MQISDEQRCQRLQTCQDLTKCVRNCLQRQRDALTQKASTSTASSEPVEIMDIENYTVGVRMMRYFDWRESEPIRVVGDRDQGAPQVLSQPKSSSAPAAPSAPAPTEMIVPTCAREVHAQWACRAISLACSPDLIELKGCFNKLGKDNVLSVPYFAYAPGDEGQGIPCRELQEKLGQCVALRAAELEQRVNARSDAGTP